MREHLQAKKIRLVLVWEMPLMSVPGLVWQPIQVMETGHSTAWYLAQASPSQKEKVRELVSSRESQMLEKVQASQNSRFHVL